MISKLTRESRQPPTSTSITFIFLLGVIIYHVLVLIYREKKPWSALNTEERDVFILASAIQPANTEITHSYVEFSTSPLELETNADEVEVAY